MREGRGEGKGGEGERATCGMSYVAGWSREATCMEPQTPAVSSAAAAAAVAAAVAA